MGRALYNSEFWIYILNHPETGWTRNEKTMEHEFRLCGKRKIASLSQELLEMEPKSVIEMIKERVMNELLESIA